MEKKPSPKVQHTTPNHEELCDNPVDIQEHSIPYAHRAIVE